MDIFTIGLYPDGKVMMVFHPEERADDGGWTDTDAITMPLILLKMLLWSPEYEYPDGNVIVPSVRRVMFV